MNKTKKLKTKMGEPFYYSAVGFHRHRCPQCGNVWEHSDEMFDNVKAHTCAKCGCGGDFGELDERCWEHYCGPEAPSKPKRRAKAVAARPKWVMHAQSRTTIERPAAEMDLFFRSLHAQEDVLLRVFRPKTRAGNVPARNKSKLILRFGDERK